MWYYIVGSLTRDLCIPIGEKKLGKVICPDTWKDGARNTTGNSTRNSASLRDPHGTTSSWHVTGIVIRHPSRVSVYVFNKTANLKSFLDYFFVGMGTIVEHVCPCLVKTLWAFVGGLFQRVEGVNSMRTKCWHPRKPGEKLQWRSSFLYPL